jgi:hypothetical protein
MSADFHKNPGRGGIWWDLRKSTSLLPLRMTGCLPRISHNWFMRRKSQPCSPATPLLHGRIMILVTTLRLVEAKATQRVRYLPPDVMCLPPTRTHQVTKTMTLDHAWNLHDGHRKEGRHRSELFQSAKWCRSMTLTMTSYSESPSHQAGQRREDSNIPAIIPKSITCQCQALAPTENISWPLTCPAYISWSWNACQPSRHAEIGERARPTRPPVPGPAGISSHASSPAVDGDGSLTDSR